AANTAAGVELNHFRDLIRQLMTSELGASEPIPALMERGARGDALAPGEDRILSSYKSADPDAWAAYRARARGIDEASDVELMAAFEARYDGAGKQLGWRELLTRMRDRMVRIGVNPAGTGRDHQVWLNEPWWRLYMPPDGEWTPLSPELRASGELRA